jgi:hypothetical protein
MHAVAIEFDFVQPLIAFGAASTSWVFGGRRRLSLWRLPATAVPITIMSTWWLPQLVRTSRLPVNQPAPSRCACSAREIAAS